MSEMPVTISKTRFGIAIDMDETIVDMMDDWLAMYNIDYDDHLTREDVKGWAVHMWVRPECGRKIYEYLSRPGFFLKCRPFTGAVEMIDRLLDADHKIVIVTSVPSSAPNAYGEKIEWLRKNVPRLPHDSLIACSRKELIRADMLLDDGAHNLHDFVGFAVCMDRPWNRADDYACDHRVFNCLQFANHVETLSSDPEQIAMQMARTLDRMASLV